MKYIVFDRSAIECITRTKEMQSVEFEAGQKFIDTLREGRPDIITYELYVQYTKNGIIISGNNPTKYLFVIDLELSKLVENEPSDDRLLLTIQKIFRTAIRIWNQQPFTSSERIHGSKSIVFPYVYPDSTRVVIERNPNSKRLTKRGIVRPLLVYKYGTDDAPRSEEIPNVKYFEEAGEAYLECFSNIIRHFQHPQNEDYSDKSDVPLIYETSEELVNDGGFRYLNYQIQLKKLTSTQKSVVLNTNIETPIRIEGPAGTGKTASMVLRAYQILHEKQSANIPFRVLFIAHSNSTRDEILDSFLMLDNASCFLEKTSAQKIIITTLFQYCIDSLSLSYTQVIEKDATEAKQTQKILIADAIEEVLSKQYKSFRPILSQEIIKLFDNTQTPRDVLVSILQHEFSIQIKGRTDGSIEEYLKLPSISNALSAITSGDKKFIYAIYREYQKILNISNVFDNDDITVAALANWNAPIWRRERETQGFNYIFVDEMHLFTLNEQTAFHYLTNILDQTSIPICFALDYSQAIGDRGDISNDFIETSFSNAEQNTYNTVFRSSQQITDFCAAISASGALMFRSSYRNPYETPLSGFTSNDEIYCDIPKLYMYDDDEQMIESLRNHIETYRKELQCKNHEIAIITFEESLLYADNIKKLERIIGTTIRVLTNNISPKVLIQDKSNDHIILSSPYNVNGLEFKGVILVGVDEGRVPQTVGVSDISAHYVMYSAFNQLYLTSSRAKYRLTLIGNKLHGESVCLQYAIKNEQLKIIESV